MAAKQTKLIQAVMDTPRKESIKSKLQGAVDGLEWSMVYSDFKSVHASIKLINELIKQLP
jgi:hypothetical protein